MMFKILLSVATLSLLCQTTIVDGYNIISVTEPQLDHSRNNAPIIGVLAQEMSYHLNTKWPGVYSSYIAASYIKFIEGGGARAVPIWIGKSKEYYEEIMSKINGVLFPGGATWFNQTNGYASAGRHIYDIARRMNDNNQYMPIFGTCLGFELILYLSANAEHRGNCNAMRISELLTFTDDYKNSKLFGSAPDDVLHILATERVTANFHIFCTTQQNWTDFGFDKEWKLLSWGKDLNGTDFVSSIEHRKYPIFGVQFHPEKVIYEWVRNRNISHTSNAIRAAQYFATFFVDQSRMSLNKFSGIDEENRVLIYNFQPTFTGLVKSAFEQSYLFTSDIDYVHEKLPDTKNGAKIFSLNTLFIGMVSILSLVHDLY